MKTSAPKYLTVALLLAAICLPASAQVRINGAAALGKLIKDKQTVIESQSGQKITVVAHAAGRGVQDLAEDRADMAMATGSLKGAADGANAAAPGTVKLDGLKEFVVGNDPLAFVVHPNNPVKSLTLAQVKDILTGKLKNWKEVGGNDAPIQLFLLGMLNGPRITLNEKLLAGAAVRGDAAVRNTPPDIVTIVSQVENGFGFIGSANLGPGVKRVETDQPVLMPLLLITKGDPTPAQKAVIDAVAKSLETR